MLLSYKYKICANQISKGGQFRHPGVSLRDSTLAAKSAISRSDKTEKTCPG